MKISELAPHPENPRTITQAKLGQLRKALLEFGDLSGIVFNRQTKHLVGGHQRVKQLDPAVEVVITKEFSKPTRTGTVAVGYTLLKGERLAYREVAWDEHREKAANIAANNGAGVWDEAQLDRWMKELASFDVDFDMELTMFDEDELKEFGVTLVKEHTRVGPTGVDEDDVPEKAPARAKLGEIYQLGRHRLMCGDSTDEKQVARLMHGEKADLWLTDPPYGVSYHPEGTKHEKIANDSLPMEEMRKFWTLAAQSALKNCTDESAYYWFACQGGDQMMMMMMMMSLGDAEWKVRHELIWVKDSLVMSRCDYHYRHEPILYGWKKDGTHQWFSDRKQDSVLEFPRPKRSESHPTMKPVELVEYLIGNSTERGSLVLDTFGGSGTTMVAAEKSERTAYLMELEPTYVDVIIERWEKYTGGKAKLVASLPKLKNAAKGPKR